MIYAMRSERLLSEEILTVYLVISDRRISAANHCINISFFRNHHLLNRTYTFLEITSLLL